MIKPKRYFLGVGVVVVLAAALTGCGTSSDHALRLSMAALETRTPTSASSSTPSPKCTHLTASLRPPATVPAARAMPRGSFMRRIENRGYLIAGVNAGAYKFGYLNPASGEIEGFEIDLVRELARAIFGDPSRYRLVALSVPQRIPAVQDNRVDIVVDAITITCYRKTQVDFSTVYYGAQQRVLVPTSSNATDITAFAGRHVCASAQSTPIQVMDALPAPPKPLGLPQAIDCLVYLQEGRVGAISTDDSILLGFQAQDANTKIIGASLYPVPYGMAINKAHPEFVRFVNGVLAKLRADGTWRAIYDKWLGGISGSNPVLPPAQYEG
jgi:polar amino acid transport system substrate-binding protein